MMKQLYLEMKRDKGYALSFFIFLDKIMYKIKNLVYNIIINTNKLEVIRMKEYLLIIRLKENRVRKINFFGSSDKEVLEKDLKDFLKRYGDDLIHCNVFEG